MKISIITASYNCADTIGNTIDSVLNQTYQEWELIIVDDGSKDNSVNIIKSYCEKDERIKLYIHKNHKNLGLKKTIQYALTKVNSDWVHFLECDDILKSDAIEKKIKIIEKHQNVGLIFSEVELFGDEKTIETYSNYMNARAELLAAENFPSKIMQKSYSVNVIPSFSCVMCKKDCLLNCDVNSPIDAYLDWYLWSQLADKDMYYIEEPLTLWRVSANSYAQIFKERYKKYYRQKYLLAIKLNIEQKSQLYKRFQIFRYDLKYFLNKIFFLGNSYDKSHKIITIMGIKIKVKRKKFVL